MTENAGTNVIDLELPPEGMSKPEIDGIADTRQRQATIQTAMKRGRYHFPTNSILPLQAGAEAQAATLIGNPAAQASAIPGAIQGATQLPPIMVPVSDLGGGGYGGGGPSTPQGATAPITEIVWGPEAAVRKRAREEAGKALAANADRLYKRGTALSIIAFPPDVGDDPDPEKRETRERVDVSLQHIRLADADDLMNQCDEAAIQFVGRKPGKPSNNPNDNNRRFSPKHPEKDPMIALLRDPELCPARKILGIARTPYMDASGAIHMTPGYNPTTMIYQDLSTLGTLTVPDNPDEADLKTAIDTIMAPFSAYDNFTKLGEQGENKWTGEILTLVLTAVNRPYLARVPLLMIAGKASGAGKGELCNALTQLAFDTSGDIIVLGREKDEFSKRVVSFILGGSQACTFDNLNDHMLDNDDIASYATEGKRTVRPFQKLGRDVTVEGRPLILINGNNLTASKDNNRRTFRVEIYTESPTPYTRHFRFNPADAAKRSRTSILSAVFTLMRWWRQKGMRDSKVTNMDVGSFQQWKREISDLVASLTGWHPGKSISDNVSLDPYTESVTTFMGCLVARFTLDRKFLASDLDRIFKQVIRHGSDGVEHSIRHEEVDRVTFPTVAAAEAHEAKILTGLERLKVYPGFTPQVRAAQEKRLLAELKSARELVNLERTAAAREQAAVEVDLYYSASEVMALEKESSGKYTVSNAIGTWFAVNSKKPVGGRMIVREKVKGDRVATIKVV